MNIIVEGQTNVSAPLLSSPLHLVGRHMLRPAASQRRHHRVSIIHAAAPHAATDLLERGPQPRIIRQGRVCREIVARRPGS